MFRPSQRSPISADEIRRRVVQETIVHAEWQTQSAEPRILTKLYPRAHSAKIEYVEMFSGGNFVLLTLADGAIDIRPIASHELSDAESGPAGPSLACAISELEMKLSGRSNRVSSTEQTGHIFVEAGHVDDSDPTHYLWDLAHFPWKWVF